jgi:transposase
MRGEYNVKSLQGAAIRYMKHFHLSENIPLRASAEKTLKCCLRLPRTLNLRTIERWFLHYLDMGELLCITSKRLGRKWRSKGRHCLCSDAEFHELELLLEREPTKYLDEMVTFMYKRFGVKYSISGMWYNLRKRGYTRKKVYEKACQAIQLRKDLFVEALRVALTDPKMLLMIDESSKSRHDAKRTHGVSKDGKPINYHAPFNMDTRYTLIGCADCFGFVPYMCDVIMHEVDEKKEISGCNTESFLEHMQTKVVPFLGNYSRGERHSVVVMDNCSIHMTEEVERLIRDAGAILIYSAPYAPDLIPIEAMFSQWKAYLRRYATEFASNWRMVHDMALASITEEDGLNYFKRTTLVELVENHPIFKRAELEIQATAAFVVVAAVKFTIDNE